MRGADVTQENRFVTRKTGYVPAGHPLVAIREILNRALRNMDVLFESIYDERGRYSVPPQWLLRGLVLQALYGIRSERLLCEQLGYNMLYRIGFGTFSTSKRAARTGRNPVTGAAIKIPAAKVTKFSAGAGLKKAVNKK